MKKKICDPIEIRGAMSRHEIVQKVVNIFIGCEYLERGSGVQFWYPVEKLSDGGQLFVFRPAQARKWNFDFKVNVEPEFGLEKGRHEDIALDLQNKKRENPTDFERLMQAITEIYGILENDVDKILDRYPNLSTSFKTGAKVDILLKILEWMFIMEDIVYWNYLGRAKLYNYLKEL